MHNLCVFSDTGELKVLTEKKVKVFGIEKVEHPKSIRGYLKNGPDSKYLITYKSSRLGILPSLYFLPI